MPIPLLRRDDEGLRLALERAGGAASLARAIGIAAAAVRQWHKVPLGRVVEVERATGISRHVLRPDIFEAEEIV